jgi:hypothetical protein
MRVTQSAAKAKKEKPMVDSLENTFHLAVAAFNNTFTHDNGYTDPEVNNFGRFYADDVKLTTRSHGTIVGKGNVLESFVQSAPLSFGPVFTNLVIDENSGIVSGDGPYHDTDNGVPNTVQIHFVFKWVLTAAGWIVKVAISL